MEEDRAAAEIVREDEAVLQEGLVMRIAELEEEKKLVEKGSWRLTSLSCAHTLVFAGDHTELKARMSGLVKNRERKIAAADRYRKLQIKAANEMFEYELKDVEATFQVRPCCLLIGRV
jgi:hypothetical protein